MTRQGWVITYLGDSRGHGIAIDPVPPPLLLGRCGHYLRSLSHDWRDSTSWMHIGVSYQEIKRCLSSLGDGAPHEAVRKEARASHNRRQNYTRTTFFDSLVSMRPCTTCWLPMLVGSSYPAELKNRVHDGLHAHAQ